MTNIAEKMVFRGTNQQMGRNICVTPANSPMRRLSYGRIILNSSSPSISFENGHQETGLICLSGQGTVAVGSETFTFGQYDSIYIPRGAKIEVKAGPNVDFAEFSSDVEGSYPLRYIPYSEISRDASLKFTVGKPGHSRQLNICLGNNIQAGRLLAGFTVSDPGNWTSWPPHEHARMLEEIYVYINMPAPGFGLQLVYNNTDYPELVVPVREGDAVLMPSGYHPNVAVPGHPIAFLWAMAAHREKEDRQYGVFNIQPGFDPADASASAGRK